MIGLAVLGIMIVLPPLGFSIARLVEALGRRRGSVSAVAVGAAAMMGGAYLMSELRPGNDYGLGFGAISLWAGGSGILFGAISGLAERLPRITFFFAAIGCPWLPSFIF